MRDENEMNHATGIVPLSTDAAAFQQASENLGETDSSENRFFGLSAFVWIALAWVAGTFLFELNIIG